MSQCTYRCVVLPDAQRRREEALRGLESQCTYRCVVLPDFVTAHIWVWRCICLNAPTGAWCSLTEDDAYEEDEEECLNAPTGAWCSLTYDHGGSCCHGQRSQCTYRCVVLPDATRLTAIPVRCTVSMHLQVRDAP